MKKVLDRYRYRHAGRRNRDLRQRPSNPHQAAARAPAPTARCPPYVCLVFGLFLLESSLAPASSVSRRCAHRESELDKGKGDGRPRRPFPAVRFYDAALYVRSHNATVCSQAAEASHAGRDAATVGGDESPRGKDQRRGRLSLGPVHVAGFMAGSASSTRSSRSARGPRYDDKWERMGQAHPSASSGPSAFESTPTPASQTARRRGCRGRQGRTPPRPPSLDAPTTTTSLFGSPARLLPASPILTRFRWAPLVRAALEWNRERLGLASGPEDGFQFDRWSWI
ncbi:hypothetical protein B0H13DRAFT_2335540 [Mycena leptocephala]|nr:hypothetical protein B0H13DRAFT_2335540 [Mycena leptocephala]